MCWFYRSILYCKLLLTCNEFLSPSRFSLLTGIHWTDTQIVQSQNISCFIMLTITVDLAAVAGLSPLVGWLFMLHHHPTSSPEPSHWLVEPYGYSKIQLSGKVLRGGALHWEIGRVPLSMPFSSQYSHSQTLYIPGAFPVNSEVGSPLHCSWQLWATGTRRSKLEGASSSWFSSGLTWSLLMFPRMQVDGVLLT